MDPDVSGTTLAIEFGTLPVLDGVVRVDGIHDLGADCFSGLDAETRSVSDACADVSVLA